MGTSPLVDEYCGQMSLYVCFLQILMFLSVGCQNVLSVETHRRAATDNTKSREVAGALAGIAPSSTARNPSHAPRGFTHILVAVDKFTKWIEVKPIKKLSSDRAVEFISEILHRFGFPNTIITDLGSNFTS